MALLVVVLLLLLAACLVVLVTFAMHGTPVRGVRVLGDGGDDASIAHGNFPQLVSVLCDVGLTGGHSVQVLSNGDEVFPRLFAAVREARIVVTWHVFWFRPGRLADEVAELLIERARAGVRVFVLFDYFGSMGLGDAYRERLREAGVETATFRPPSWKSAYKAQQRSHMRSVVIDGRTGFTGGFGIDDRWRGDGRHEGQWRDTSVCVQGPAVAQLQGAFASDWGEATGELLVGDQIFPFGTDVPGDGTCAGLMFSAPSFGSTSAERLFVLTIESARERLWITSAYFVPDRHFRRLLCEAARRGVDVRVLTPGGNSDRPSTWYASRAHYEELLADGVRLYEYDPTMLHAKTFVADGRWCTIGTMNIDNRSMVLNDEAVLVIYDRDHAARLERMFEEDLRHATAVELDAFRRRPRWPDRLLEWGAARVDRVL